MDRPQPPRNEHDFSPEQRRRLNAEMRAEKSQEKGRNQRLENLRNGFRENDKSMTGFMNKLKELPENAKRQFDEIEQKYGEMKKKYTNEVIDGMFEGARNYPHASFSRRFGRSDRNASEINLRQAHT